MQVEHNTCPRALLALAVLLCSAALTCGTLGAAARPLKRAPAAAPSPAAPSTPSSFGCLRVTGAEINLRAKPLNTADVVGQARQNDILIKRRRSCTPRGGWCAVATLTNIEGYAEKSQVAGAPCPAAASKAPN